MRPSRLASFDWREDLNRQMAVSFLGPETSALTPLSFPYPEHTSLHPHCYRAHRATILLRLHNRMWPPSPALATLHLQDSSQSGLWKMGVRPCRCPAPNVRQVPAPNVRQVPASLWVKARVLAMTANMVFPQPAPYSSSLTSCDSPPLPGPLTAATLASSSLSHQEGLAAAVPSLAHSTPLHGSPSLPQGFAHLSHLLERPTMATLVSAVTCPAPSATSRSAFSTFPVSHSSLL